jgi:phosphatidylglycerophosphatase A
MSTFFYVGFIPAAPGSLASLLGVFVCLILSNNLFAYLMTFAVVTALGFLTGTAMEKLAKEKDPGCVVIDEVSGMMIALFLLPMTVPVLWTTFFLFRAFDMFKIYPANLLEKRHGSVGIMMDDIVAGIYTNLTMQVAVRVAGII